MQLPGGKLFALGKPDKQSQNMLLQRLAGVLKVKKVQVMQSNKSHAICAAGVRVKAERIAVAPYIDVR